MRRQAKMHNKEPTNAEMRSSKVILISPRPKSMWNSRNRNPPTSAPSIPTAMLIQGPKPRFVKVTRRPARVPASAPIISQTMISPMEIDTIESFLFGQCYSPETVIRTRIVASEKQLCNFAFALRRIGTARLPFLFIGRTMNTVGLLSLPTLSKYPTMTRARCRCRPRLPQPVVQRKVGAGQSGKQSLALGNQPTNRYAS